MPERQVTALFELQEYYTGGRVGTPDGTLARLLGRPPRTMDRLLKEPGCAKNPVSQGTRLRKEQGAEFRGAARVA